MDIPDKLMDNVVVVASRLLVKIAEVSENEYHRKIADTLENLFKVIHVVSRRNLGVFSVKIFDETTETRKGDNIIVISKTTFQLSFSHHQECWVFMSSKGTHEFRTGVFMSLEPLAENFEIF